MVVAASMSIRSIAGMAGLLCLGIGRTGGRAGSAARHAAREHESTCSDAGAATPADTVPRPDLSRRRRTCDRKNYRTPTSRGPRIAIRSASGVAISVKVLNRWDDRARRVDRSADPSGTGCRCLKRRSPRGASRGLRIRATWQAKLRYGVRSAVTRRASRIMVFVPAMRRQAASKFGQACCEQFLPTCGYPGGRPWRGPPARWLRPRGQSRAKWSVRSAMSAAKVIAESP